MKVLVIPKDKNPYQSLLYYSMHKEVSIKYLKGFTRSRTLNLFTYPFLIIKSRLEGYNLVHIHWLWDFVFPVSGYAGRIISTFYCLSILSLIRILNFKIVWTLHNVLPHEDLFVNDLFVRKFLAKITTTIIVHSRSILDELKVLKINTDKSAIIQHGTYIGYYKNEITRNEARKRLNLNDNDFVYLFFGMIKKYKGIEDLLVSYEKILNIHKSKRLKIVIAGMCLDEDLIKLINEFKFKYPKHIVTVLHHIEDEDVQVYFNAADIVVLPFKKNTTSGSALLALSFGKPIIAPLIGSINDLPSNTGLFYSYPSINNLYEKLEIALSEKDLRKRGINGLNFVQKISWYDIANKTYQIFKRL